MSVVMVRQKALNQRSPPPPPLLLGVGVKSGVCAFASGHHVRKKENIFFIVAGLSMVSPSFPRCVPKVGIFATRRPCTLIVWRSAETSTRAERLPEELSMSV